ncbi:MAG: DUF2341 domain-containing protein [Labilithrix sp.]|nr:DUF2341 domain-containing protein [Labilithrix sp.]MCW5813787.1 DUF2341 domain-containing protein [Labilithrix sp.]
MVIRALALAAAFTLASLGCATVLGGLDDGAPRDAGAEIEVEAGTDATPAPAPAPTCAWLGGFAHRVPLRVEHTGPRVAGYQVALALPASLAAKPDGADLRPTLADGVTRVPYWIEPDGAGAAKKLWMRVDLEERPIDLWLYYGAPSAESEASRDATFVRGAIENPTFDGPRGWTTFDSHESTTSTDQRSVTIADGKASFWMARQPDPNGATIGACQRASFASGSRYRFLFDLTLTVTEHAGVTIFSGELEPSSVVWWLPGTNLHAPARVAHLQSGPFDEGVRTVCLVASTVGGAHGTAIGAELSNLRVRRWLDGDRIATIVGPAEASCER